MTVSHAAAPVGGTQDLFKPDGMFGKRFQQLAPALSAAIDLGAEPSEEELAAFRMDWGQTHGRAILAGAEHFKATRRDG